MKEHTIFKGADNMISIIVMAMVIVFIAMMLDLVSGLYKAKQRGEIRSSQALKRTITKFITYEGSMLIAAGVDLLFHISKIVRLFGMDIIYGVPVITCMVGVFTLIVEFISIREKADQKTKKEMNEAAKLIASMMQNDSFKEALRTALEQNNLKRDEAEK